MKFLRSEFPGLVEILPERFKDERGYFQVTYNLNLFKKENLPIAFVQDNESYSDRGVLRGMHLQKAPHAQGKLVRVSQGSVQDVVIDLRHGSPTYLKWKSFLISSHTGNMLYVPEGFAHGFLALEDKTVFSYKCTRGYSKESECGIRWDDKTLAIDWEIEPKQMSEKDNRLLNSDDALKQLEFKGQHDNSCTYSKKGLWQHLCFCGASQYVYEH
jgi:dTDP-4-dehydrorhamnose 3,5-epimerase